VHYHFEEKDIDGVVESSDGEVALIVSCKLNADRFLTTGHLEKFATGNVQILVDSRQYKRVHIAFCALFFSEDTKTKVLAAWKCVVPKLENVQFDQARVIVPSELLVGLDLNPARISRLQDRWPVYYSRKMEIHQEITVLIGGRRGVGKTSYVRHELQPDVFLDMKDWVQIGASAPNSPIGSDNDAVESKQQDAKEDESQPNIDAGDGQVGHTLKSTGTHAAKNRRRREKTKLERHLGPLIAPSPPVRVDIGALYPSASTGATSVSTSDFEGKHNEVCPCGCRGSLLFCFAFSERRRRFEGV
jgi:hypothetical protein